MTFERLHSERANVIKETYKGLAKCYRAISSYMSQKQMAGEPTAAEKGKAAADAANEFREYFDENRIFFEEELELQIDNFLKLIKKSWLDFEYKDIEPKDSAGKWLSTWKFVDEEMPKIRKELEKEFRKILGL